MSAKPKYWYIVFTGADGRTLFGYFTIDFLKETDPLLETTVVHSENRPLPAKCEENTEYLFEGEHTW